MHKFKIILIFLLIYSNTCYASFNNYDKEVALKNVKKVIKQASEIYKRTLFKGLENNSIKDAMNYCKKEVSKIVTLENKNYEIKRTSLRTRNKYNRPTEYEKKVLKKFNIQNSFDKSSSLVFSEIIKREGVQELFFMKAIRVKDVCLNCHGKNIDENLKHYIKGLYPEDKAIGYKLNDVRGAFVVYYKLSN